MNKFDFKYRARKVEIAGKERTIYLESAESIHKLFEAKDKIVSKIEELQKVGADVKSEHITDVIYLCKTIIEIVLGETAYNEIYEASAGNINNLLDLITFLVDEVTELKKCAVNEYTA